MDWLAPHFTVDQLAAEDVCLEEVRKHLAADATLRGIFREQILALAFLPPDVGVLPALIVTPLANEEIPVPGARETRFSLYMVVKFVYPRNARLAAGKAGLPTLFRHIRGVLSAPGARSLTVRHAGVEIPLVKRFEPAAGVTYQPEPAEPGSTNVVFNAIQRFELEANLDPTTRQIWNLAVNG